MGDDFTQAFESAWCDLRARWCVRHDLGGAVAFTHPQVKIPMTHRVVQVGVELSEVDGLIDAALALFQRQRHDCAFTLSPLDRPANLAEHLTRRGFALTVQAAAMVFDPQAQPGAAPSAQVVVEVQDPSQYGKWSEVMCRSFDLPEEVAEIGRRALATEAVRLYLAHRGGEPAGTAILYSRSGLGYVDLVGTLPEHRRQGVARALTARVVADSVRQGNRWTALEVDCESPAERIYSEAGFRRTHLRPRYVHPVG
jgi:ribosomal protein S18 acetylase RimI-like enzyme